MAEDRDTKITYFFPDRELDDVSVYSPHVPNVGDRVAFSSLELRPTNPAKNYGNRNRYWKVKERIFCCCVATAPESLVRIGNQQHVEVYLERWEDI